MEKGNDAVRQLDVHQVIDNVCLARFHRLIVVLCALLLIFDVVLSAIVQEVDLRPCKQVHWAATRLHCGAGDKCQNFSDSLSVSSYTNCKL